MNDIIISAKNVSKKFGNVQILNNISIDIYDKDFTVIMGTSGAGKSTFLYCLSGMDKITDGKVIYNEQEISSFNEKRMSELRTNNFGFVFQQSYLISNLTLFENIAVAGYINKKHTAKEVNDKAHDILKKMGVDKAENRFPSQVSGGETQRAALARAIINSPDIIFADEPTGALNKKNSNDVLNLLSELNRNGQNIIMVTHDLRAAIRGSRILYLEDGKITSELKLSAYNDDDAKDRETQVNNWLSVLQW
jgi:putative ABC transport system ATP-binding protein